MPMERTLAIIKPDAFDRSEEIEEIIKNEEFAILQVWLTKKHIIKRVDVI